MAKERERRQRPQDATWASTLADFGDYGYLQMLIAFKGV